MTSLGTPKWGAAGVPAVYREGREFLYNTSRLMVNTMGSSLRPSLKRPETHHKRNPSHVDLKSKWADIVHKSPA